MALVGYNSYIKGSGSFSRGSSKASKRRAWKLRKGEFGISDFQRGVLEFQV